MDKKRLPESVLPHNLVSDEQFGQLLRAVNDENRKWVEEQKPDGFPPELSVYVKHSTKEDFTRVIISMPDFPPPDDSPIDNFEMMELLGSKYYTEMVLKKEKGQKCFPLVVFMTTEGWAIMETDEETAKRVGEKKKIADMEKKTEMLITAGMTLDKRQNQAHTLVFRDGEQMRLGETTYMDYEPEIQDSHNILLYHFYIGFVGAMRGSQ